LSVQVLLTFSFQLSHLYLWFNDSDSQRTMEKKVPPSLLQWTHFPFVDLSNGRLYRTRRASQLAPSCISNSFSRPWRRWQQIIQADLDPMVYPTRKPEYRTRCNVNLIPISPSKKRCSLSSGHRKQTGSPSSPAPELLCRSEFQLRSAPIGKGPFRFVTWVALSGEADFSVIVTMPWVCRTFEGSTVGGFGYPRQG
jgi:hypothetical protein